MTIKDAQFVLIRGGKVYHRSFTSKAYLTMCEINNRRTLAQFYTGNDSTPIKTYGDKFLEQVATSEIYKDGWFELVSKTTQEKIPTPKVESKPKDNPIVSKVKSQRSKFEIKENIKPSDYESLKPSSNDWDDLKSIFKK